MSTGEPTGGSSSAWDFAPAQDTVSHGQALALTEVVLTTEVAVAARDHIKPQPQGCKTSLAFILKAPAGPFYILPSQLCTQCVQGSEYKRAQVKMTPQHCQVFVYFSSSFKAHLKLEVQLVLTYVTDHKNAHQSTV